MEIKDRIKQKADELYRRYGVKSVTMDEIASQLGVSKKTIYHSFSDKNELVDAVVGDMLNFNRQCCKSCSTDAKDAVEEIFLGTETLYKIMSNMNPSFLFDIERGHPSVYKKFTAFKYEFLLKIIAENIERGKKEGLYRDEISVSLISKIRIETLLLPFNEELFPRNQYSFIKIQKEILEFFLFGMVNPTGYKMILKYQKEYSKKQQ